jgi:hypothetical protein
MLRLTEFLAGTQNFVPEIKENMSVLGRNFQAEETQHTRGWTINITTSQTLMIARPHDFERPAYFSLFSVILFETLLFY